MLYVLISIFVIYALIPNKKARFGFIKLKNYIIPLCVISLLILLVVFSEDAFNSAHNGLLLWINNVVPSLFPFLICIEILKKTNIIQVIGKLLEPIIRPVFNIPGSGAFAIVMGMCSGYPVGAKFAASLQEANQCSLIEGERLLAFTNTSGPLFIVGSVGIGMFTDSKIGFLLLITHFIAALIVGIIFRFYKKEKSKSVVSNKNTTNSNNSTYTRKNNERNIKKNKGSEIIKLYNYIKNNEKDNESIKACERIKLSNLGSIMGEAIKNSISTLLLICGFITFFCVLGAMLDKSGVTDFISSFACSIFVKLGFSKNMINELSIGCFKGILEITNGLKILANSSIDFEILLPIVATILGFGGISVHMQVASIISNSDLSIKPYLLGKTLHGIFAGILTYLVINYTNFLNLEAVETFSSMTAKNIGYSNISGFIGSGNLLIMGVAFIILISLFRLLFKKSTYTN